MKTELDGVIVYLERWVTINDLAITRYKESVAGAEDDIDPITNFEIKTIAILEEENKQAEEAIKILKSMKKTRYFKLKNGEQLNCSDCGRLLSLADTVCVTLDEYITLFQCEECAKKTVK